MHSSSGQSSTARLRNKSGTLERTGLNSGRTGEMNARWDDSERGSENRGPEHGHTHMQR